MATPSHIEINLNGMRQTVLEAVSKCERALGENPKLRQLYSQLLEQIEVCKQLETELHAIDPGEARGRLHKTKHEELTAGIAMAEAISQGIYGAIRELNQAAFESRQARFEQFKKDAEKADERALHRLLEAFSYIETSFEKRRAEHELRVGMKKIGKSLDAPESELPITDVYAPFGRTEVVTDRLDYIRKFFTIFAETMLSAGRPGPQTDLLDWLMFHGNLPKKVRDAKA